MSYLKFKKQQASALWKDFVNWYKENKFIIEFFGWAFPMIIGVLLIAYLNLFEIGMFFIYIGLIWVFVLLIAIAIENEIKQYKKWKET